MIVIIISTAMENNYPMNCYVIYEKIVIVLNAVITKLFIIIYVQFTVKITLTI